MKSRSERRAGSRGTSLVEILIAVVAVVSLFVVVLGVEQSTLRGIRANERAADPVDKVGRLADRLDREVRMAGFLTLQVPGVLGLQAPVQGQTYDELHFRRVVGFTTAGPIYGPLTTFRRALDAGEIADGADNDGDGLVDEGVVILEVQGGPTAAIASNATEFTVRLVAGRQLELAVEIGMPASAGSPSLRRRVERTITLRNN